MDNRKYKSLKWLSCLIMVFIIFVLSAVIFFTVAPKQIFVEMRDEMDHSKALWEDQGIRSYRFLVRYDDSFLTCEEDILVTDGEAAVISSNCKQNHRPPRTIPDLFSKIKAVIDERKCGFNGCRCDGPIVAKVVYDQEFGFPKETKFDIQPEQSKLYVEYWLSKRSFIPQPCTLLGLVAPTYEIKDFEPIDETK